MLLHLLRIFNLPIFSISFLNSLNVSGWKLEDDEQPWQSQQNNEKQLQLFLPHVLPAIITGPPSDLHHTPPVPFSHKEKEHAIPSPISHRTSDHKPVTPAPGIGVASTSAPHAGPSVQKRKTQVCASCKSNNCPNTSTCKGSGNRKLCVCTTHTAIANPRAPK